jgi:16S rRNA (adenine1518-N6/adenine1519-N6)-dimethyltransferase
MPYRTRPKLGQHFLSSAVFRRRVAGALPLLPNDVVVEVGPGRGAITPLIAARVAHVVAVELDSALADFLRSTLGADSRVEIVAADILTVDMAALCRRLGGNRVYVFGNLPYYATSPILRHLMAASEHIRGMAFVVQREVAERISARPGSRAYGYLSVMMQSRAVPQLAFTIPPGAFSPPPKVHSALVTVEFMKAAVDRDSNGFLEFAKLAFARKRKTLANNLSAEYTRVRIENVYRKLGLRAHVRAEQLSVEQLRSAFEALSDVRSAPERQG